MRCALLAFALIGCSDNRAPDSVLIYTRTLGYRHADAIDAAAQVLPGRLETEGISSAWTDDPDVFAAALPDHRAVFFLYTCGNDILDPAGKADLERFVRGGRGFIGLHSAADTEYLWPFYQALQVAPFESHPVIQAATIDVVDRTHPAMAQLPEPSWSATDEWYNFPRDPGELPTVHVLATLDETSYVGGTMGDHHPIIWEHSELGGRALYSALGHVAERWQDPVFVDHVVGGVRWVLGHD